MNILIYCTFGAVAVGLILLWVKRDKDRHKGLSLYKRAMALQSEKKAKGKYKSIAECVDELSGKGEE